MKNFTEKQIETFMNAINNNILEYMNENFMIDELEKVSGKLSDIEKGDLVLLEISKKEVNRGIFIKLLGLRDFATKEEIIKEINEIL